MRQLLDEAEQHYRSGRSAALERKLETEASLRTELGRAGLDALKRANYNKDIASLALNLRAGEGVRLSGDRLVQVVAPICQPPTSAWGGAPIMAAHKRLGRWLLPTFTFNLAVLWAMTIVLYTALTFALLPRLAAWLGAAMRRLPGRGRTPS